LRLEGTKNGVRVHY